MLSKYLNCFLISSLFLFSFTALTAQNCTSNLVNNPGFEQGISGWNVVFGNANASSDANSGSSAIELGGAIGDHVINQAYVGKPNTEYTVRAFMKQNNTNSSSAFAQIRFFNASWQQLPVLPVAFNADSYTEVVATRTSPANTAYVGIEFSYRPRNASDVVVIDDVCFVEGTSVPSGGCSIAANVTSETCDDNGTAALNDDVSSATIMVNNGGASGSYTATYRVGTVDYTATGTYGSPLTITGIQSISFGNASIPVEITDNADQSCLTTVSFRVSEACSTPNPGACNLSVNITNSACFDNGTPNNPADDYYNATLTINNPTGSMEGADISYVLDNRSVNFFSPYGSTININNISIQQDGALSIFIVDHADPNCFETRSTTPPQSCSNGGTTGGSGADLELTATSTATNVPAWSNATVKFTLTNNGTSTASNINVGLNIDANATPRGGNEFTASQGTLASFWTRNPTWQVGALAPGQSATIDLNLFTLSANEIPVYGQVSSATGNDPDSTPGNGTCCTANEDDEAAFNINGNNNPPPPPPPGGGNANILGLSASSANPAVGSTFTASITLKNVSFSLPVNNVQVRFQLPAGVSFASNPFTTANGSFANGVWNVGTMAGNASANIRFNLVRNTANGFPLTATVISGTTGGNTTETINIQGSTPPPGGGNANIFGLSASSANPAVGATFTSQVTLKNVSFSLPTNNVQVRFELPAGVSFASNPFSTAKGTYANGVWNVGTLDGNESAFIIFNLVRNTASGFPLTAEIISGATGGRTTETINIQGSTPPPPSGNGADLEISFPSSIPSPSQWGNFTTTLVARNTGTEPINNAVVNLTTPDEIVFQGGNPGSTSNGDFFPYTALQWRFGVLAPGQSATLDINYFRLSANPFTIYAEVVMMDATDPDSTPNNGTCCTPQEDDEAALTVGSAARGVNNRSAVSNNLENNLFAITNAYPNPTNGKFKVDVYSTEETSSELTVFDILGKPVYQQEVNLVEGHNSIPVNLETVNAGFLNIQMTPAHKYLRQIRVMKITD